jgi:hypothetical protein
MPFDASEEDAAVRVVPEGVGLKPGTVGMKPAAVWSMPAAVWMEAATVWAEPETVGPGETAAWVKEEPEPASETP